MAFRFVFFGVLTSTLIADLAAATQPLTLERVLTNTARNFWPTNDDYNNDGVQDLMIQHYGFNSVHARIISGTDASVIRQYDAPPNYNNAFGRYASLPDSDGDGRREILLGDPTHLWAIKSSVGGGRVDQLPNMYSYSGLPFGLFITANSRSAVVASGDEKKLIFLDPTTGAVQARLQNNNLQTNSRSLGNSIASIGDITGDGIADFATGAANEPHPTVTGSVFLIDGTVATSGAAYTQIKSLPAGKLIGELSGTQFLGHGEPGGWENMTVNLGDPSPSNGKIDSLIVSGSPWGNFEAGGFSAHLVTKQGPTTYSTQTLATYVGAGKWNYGSALLNLGDVNGDQISDLAIMAESYGTSAGQTGRIQVISGAGLIDGFDPNIDVLQTIDGAPQANFYGSFQFLGDYDNDGRLEVAASVAYGGLGGVYGASQHIYEIIPEPAFALTIACGMFLLAHRRRAR